jgi:hypothetical protein
MNMLNAIGLKVVACAAAAIVLTAGLSYSFVESTAVVHAQERSDGTQTYSLGLAHGGAPLAPFGAVLRGRSATLVG